MICIFSDRHVDALAAAGGFADAFARDREEDRAVDLKTDAGRWNARAELCAVIEPWVAAHTADEVSAALKKAGALWAPYQTFRELRPTRTPCSTIRCSPCSTSPASAAIRSPPRRCSSAPSPREPPKPAPVLGQHTDEILSGILGLPAHEIARLHDEKVVGSADKEVLATLGMTF